MIEVVEITDDFRQSFILSDENGNNFNFELSYIQEQSCWFFNLTYDNFVINNQRLTTSTNILTQYKNRLPFGIIVVNEDSLDPLFLDSFIDGTTQLFIATHDEIQELESVV